MGFMDPPKMLNIAKGQEDNPFNKAYVEAYNANSHHIRIFSYSCGEDEIIDIEFLKKKHNATAIAVYREKTKTRFEVMEVIE